MLPKGTAHVNGVICGYGPLFEKSTELLSRVGLWSGLPTDFLVRAASFGHFYGSVVEGLPGTAEESVKGHIVERTARLICLTSAYAPLWQEVMGEPWSPSSPVRLAAERRQLMVELDALAALSLGLTPDELCIIYRTQFPVLRGYEQNDLYDANGRKVPNEMNKLYRKVGEQGMESTDLLWTHPQSQVEYRYEFPFRSFDREEDMRAAYARFEKELGPATEGEAKVGV